MKEIFIREFIMRLADKLPTEQLNMLSQELSIYCDDFQITRTTTELAPVQLLPRAYKAFMVTKKIEGRSLGTLEQYKLRLEPFFQQVGKDLPNITTNDIRRYLYLFQDQRGVSNRTLDNMRHAFNSFFSWCAKEGYCEKNVCEAIGPIKYTARPINALSDVEMEALRSACRTPREHAIVETLYSTGCRVSELCALNRNRDIDFSTRDVELFGKGSKVRFSGLNARAVIALKEYLVQRTDDCEALFIGERKKERLQPGGIRKILKKIADRVSVKDVHPHRIRHTFATDAIQHGMPITHLQKLMGHAQIGTTMIYVDVPHAQVRTSHQKYVV